MSEQAINVALEPIVKLNKDLIKSITTLSTDEARFAVDAYYQMQDYRIQTQGQIRSCGEGEPHLFLDWQLKQMQTFENQIKRGLEAFADSQDIGRWMQSIIGIGPVITAGLIAHIDIHKAKTAGHIWRYAGLDPTMKWEKKTKRPWNASLKTLCWKIGESFVKVSGREDAFYGRIYKERKDYETEKNERGEYAEQAARVLKEKKFGKDTKARGFYEKGQLPPGHIHARAKRYAVKLFLSHLQQVWWELEFEESPPKPFVIEHLGHAHIINPPNWPMGGLS